LKRKEFADSFGVVGGRPEAMMGPRLRGPFGARDEFLLAAIAQNLRKLAKLILPPALKPA
jgi:hypothetical protein